MSDLLDLSGFQDQLANSAQEPRDDNNDNQLRLNKITMSSRDYMGKIIFVPLIPLGSGLPWIHFTRPNNEIDNRTFEMKLWNDDYEDFVWFKLLPKSYYTDLTPEESALYDQTVSRFKSAQDDDLIDFNTSKRGNYSLIFGKVINHFNTTNEIVEKTVGKIALISFPSASTAGKIKENNDSINLMMNGNNQWLTSVYNNNLTDRTAAIKVSFNRGASMGYDVSVEHLFNNHMIKAVPDDFVITQEELALCTDLVGKFLGFNKGDGRLFNPDTLKAMNMEFDRLYNISDAQTAEPSTTPLTNNNAASDPMLAGAQVNSPVSNPTPEVQTQVPASGNIDPLAGISTPPNSTPPGA